MRSPLLVLAVVASVALALDTGFFENATCPETISNDCPTFYMVPFADWHEGVEADLSPAIRALMRERLNQYLAHWLNVQGPSVRAGDSTVFTGAAGYALAMLKLAVLDQTNMTRGELVKLAAAYADMALDIASTEGGCQPSSGGQCTSFLESHVGVWAVAALVEAAKGNASGAARFGQMIDAVVVNVTASPLSASPFGLPNSNNEGRTGLLYACYLLQESGVPGCSEEHVLTLIQALLDVGVNSANTTWPMMWWWCPQQQQCTAVVYGSGHGMLGIAAQLLSASAPSATQYPPQMEPFLAALMDLQLSSGNYPTAPYFQQEFDVGPDVLVQWCHGAPGFVPVMVEAAAKFPANAERYLEAAANGARAIWARGVLTKGLSLCHGTSGNTYSLLQLYRATSDPRWLYYASTIQTFVLTSPLMSELDLMRVPTPVPLASSSFWAGSWLGALCLWSDMLYDPWLSQMTGYMGGLNISLLHGSF